MFCFTSRRRHTRWPRDWSSDVCSSDLDLKDLLLNDYKQTFNSSSDPDDPDHQLYLEKKKMRLTIISTARQSIYSLARHRKISDELARQLVRQLDFDEYRFK